MTRKRTRHESSSTARAKSCLTYAEQQMILNSPASASHLTEMLKQEQEQYLKLWKAEMMSCSVCIASRGKPNAIPHCCVNHNYLPKCVDGVVPTLLTSMMIESDFGGQPNLVTTAARTTPETGNQCSGPPCHRLKVEDICTNAEQRDPPPHEALDVFEHPTSVPLETLSALCHWCTDPTYFTKSELLMQVQMRRDDSTSVQTSFGGPLRNPCPRRHILESVFRAAVLRDDALFSPKCFRREKLTREINLNSTAVAVSVEGFVNQTTQVPLVPLVKIEYSSCRMYNAQPDDQTSHVLEEFSSRELITMGFSCRAFPAAEFKLFRVCPYTCAVIKTELMTSAQLELLLGESFRDRVPSLLKSTWEVFCDLRKHCLGEASEGHNSSLHDDGCGAPNVPMGTSRDVRMWIKLGPDGFRTDDEAPTLHVEPQGAFVCRREYLQPSSWEHTERPPFTFRSEDEQSQFKINWKLSVRDPNEYRQHDVWSHHSKVFECVDGVCI